MLTPQTRTPTAHDLILAWYEKPDPALLAPEFSCTAVGYPTAHRHYTGAAGMLDAFFSEIGAQYDVWSVGVDRVIEAGEDIVVIGSYDARPKGAEAAVYPFVHVWTARNGAIQSVICCTDVRPAAPAS